MSMEKQVGQMDKWTNGDKWETNGKAICPDNLVGQMVCGSIDTHHMSFCRGRFGISL